MNIEGFVVDKEYFNLSNFHDLPVNSSDNVATIWPSSEYCIHIAMGYHDMNKARENIYNRFKALGYTFYSYISPQAYVSPDATLGDNNFIMDGSSIQAGVTLKDNVAVWSNAVIGHHSTIAENSWIVSSASIAGSTNIGKNCFVGMDATIGHEITIGDNCLIGAGAVITKSTEANGVYIAQDTERFRLETDYFLKMTKMK